MNKHLINLRILALLLLQVIHHLLRIFSYILGLTLFWFWIILRRFLRWFQFLFRNMIEVRQKNWFILIHQVIRSTPLLSILKLLWCVRDLMRVIILILRFIEFVIRIFSSITSLIILLISLRILRSLKVTIKFI